MRIPFCIVQRSLLAAIVLQATGLGCFHAQAAVYEVSSSAALQAALNEAAVNGEADTIRLAAGVYRTSENSLEAIAGPGVYPDDLDIGPAVPFTYAPRFDDDIPGSNRCPEASGQMCLEVEPLTIEGAGPGLTVLDGGQQSQVLNINLSLFRGDESVNSAVRFFAPDYSAQDYADGSSYDGVIVTEGKIQNAQIAVLQPGPDGSAALVDDSKTLITLRSLGVVNGVGGGEQGRQEDLRRLRAEFLVTRCGWLSDDALGYFGYNFSDSCLGGGVSIDTNNASVLIDTVRFEGNRTLEHGYINGWSEVGEGGGLTVNVIGGNVTVRNSTFEGNSAEGAGGGAFLLSRYGNVTLSDSTFGGESQELVNSAGQSGGGLFAMVGPALVWDRPGEYREEMPPNADCNAISQSRIDATQASSPSGYLQGELFPDSAICAGTLTVETTTFQGNAGKGGGAASLVAHYGTRGAVLKDVGVSDNRSCLQSSTARSNCAGGGVQLEIKSGVGSIRNSRFDSNESNHEGGGLYVNSERPISIVDSLFTNNTSRLSGAGLAARGLLNLERNTIAGNKVTADHRYSWEITGAGARVRAAGFVDGQALKVHRNRIENNEAAVGAAGISVNAAHHDVDVTSNFIVGNRTLNAFNGYKSMEWADVRTAAGAELVTVTGIVNVINNTVADNAILEVDEVTEVAGGVYVRAESSEALDDWPDENSNHPNYLVWVDPKETPTFPLSASLSRVYNNNFWGNTIARVPVSRSLAAESSLETLASDLFVEDGSLEYGVAGANVRVFNNNFSDLAAYEFECAENCEQEQGNNLSEDPLFKTADDGLLQVSSPLLGSADLSVPGLPKEDFYGLTILSIGAFWTGVSETLKSVPVLGGPLGLLLLIVALGLAAASMIREQRTISRARLGSDVSVNQYKQG